MKQAYHERKRSERLKQRNVKRGKSEGDDDGDAKAGGAAAEADGYVPAPVIWTYS